MTRPVHMQLNLVQGNEGNTYDVSINLTGPIILGLALSAAVLAFMWIRAVERAFQDGFDFSSNRRKVSAAINRIED